MEQNLRYERKFYLRGASENHLRYLIKNTSAFFSEAYPPRTVNNIYFDTPCFKHYRDNVDGVSSRRKYRIRWYGALGDEVGSPFLEIKIKEGHVGRKERYNLDSFPTKSIHEGPAFWTALLHKSNVPDAVIHHFKAFRPALVNRYEREYFLSADKNLRLTLDHSLGYYSAGSIMGRSLPPLGIYNKSGHIIELKYDQDAVFDSNVGKFFPFRMTKSSKYVMGIDLLHA